MRNQSKRLLRIEILEERALLAVWSGNEMEISAYPLNGADDTAAMLSTETAPPEIKANSLSTPTIITGTAGRFVSYGANRHIIQWGYVDNADCYELAYSGDGVNWQTVTTFDTAAQINGLTYGADIQYKVRALTGTQTSAWSKVKTFKVCPMDINNDGDIAGADRSYLANSWLSSEGDEEFVYFCDINGDGDIAGADRSFIATNWLLETDDEDIIYPNLKAADTAITEYISEFGIDLNTF